MTKMWGVKDPTGMILLANISDDFVKLAFRDQMQHLTGVCRSWEQLEQKGYKLVEVEVMGDELEALRDKMHEIRTWVNAYPLDIFPEPDFEKAHKVLRQNGMSLDAISASNMRHVLDGIKKIIEEVWDD